MSCSPVFFLALQRPVSLSSCALVFSRYQSDQFATEIDRPTSNWLSVFFFALLFLINRLSAYQTDLKHFPSSSWPPTLSSVFAKRRHRNSERNCEFPRYHFCAVLFALSVTHFFEKGDARQSKCLIQKKKGLAKKKKQIAIGWVGKKKENTRREGGGVGKKKQKKTTNQKCLHLRAFVNRCLIIIRWKIARLTTVMVRLRSRLISLIQRRLSWLFRRPVVWAKRCDCRDPFPRWNNNPSPSFSVLSFSLSLF